MRIIRLDQLQPFQAVDLLSDPGAIGGPVVIPNAAQIRLKWTMADGKTGYNVLYGRTGGVPAPTVAQANAIFAALSTGAQWTALAAFLGINQNFAGVDIRSVNTAAQPLFASTTPPVVGAAAGQPLPSEVAVVVTLRTALAGPQNRGRFYVPNWTSDALAATNVIAAGAVTALANWANTISGAFSAQGYTWCIGKQARASYTGSTGTLHPARAATTEAVTTALVRDNHWDSQRRRGLR